MRTLAKLCLVISAFILVAGLSGGARPAHAEGGYGSAGCGLGSMLFGAKPGFIQVLAATTNGLFGSQTFGITSGTSNCKDAGGGMPSTAAFIQTNREAFAKDVSRGSGETINAVAALAGCGDAKAVGARLQASFKTIFPKAGLTDEAVSTSAVAVLKGDQTLACTRLL
jgi:hypothetical protein